MFLSPRPTQLLHTTNNSVYIVDISVLPRHRRIIPVNIEIDNYPNFVAIDATLSFNPSQASTTFVEIDF